MKVDFAVVIGKWPNSFAEYSQRNGWARGVRLSTISRPREERHCASAPSTFVDTEQYSLQPQMSCIEATVRPDVSRKVVGLPGDGHSGTIYPHPFPVCIWEKVPHYGCSPKSEGAPDGLRGL